MEIFWTQIMPVFLGLQLFENGTSIQSTAHIILQPFKKTDHLALGHKYSEVLITGQVRLSKSRFSPRPDFRYPDRLA
jgi:hypothetical protein